MIRLIALLVALFVFSAPCPAQVRLPPGVSRLELSVEGLARTGLVYAPAKAKEEPVPVVFVFHGHGGSAQSAGRMFQMFKLWPEAISVYLQGLNTPGKLTDPEGKKPGWQHGAGVQGDRDLKLFDAVLAHLKKTYKVDEKRVFATGHSNGGGFTYLLWETRPDVFCALAPSAAASVRLTETPFKPKPLMHSAGSKDPLVKFEWQQTAMDKVKQINQCEGEGKPWATNCTLYPSKVGAPFVAFIHPGGHQFPPGEAALIARFFKEQAAAVK